MALKIERGSKGAKTDMKEMTSCTLPVHLKQAGFWEWTWKRKVWKVRFSDSRTVPVNPSTMTHHYPPTL